ncbi:MAG: VWA domain-containing protein [Chloroflexi bacterium]|uniref:VWA domain-containing protein n=1 Tax=Candidatus Chlorohelix allophototropha TaxID=3003348 RepID=A0A8T7M5Y4_9CHLR|nr:VWA domain-containing protein [Chloroflexota bacterium]WJW69424.1 VWA domain-containing protein [Chloroflexota bacterium L227-S17]
MFDVSAYQNPYLRTGASTMQAVVSLSLEDSGPVKTGSMPLALSIIIDRSGSMEGQKIEAAKDAAIRVIQSADPSTAFMVVTFNETANVIVPPTSATTESKTRAIAAIRNIYSNGGTCMSTGLAAVAREMSSAQGRARKILFLTDGKNEGEKRNILDKAVQRVKEADIEVSAWGMGVDWDENELKYIANETKGSADIIPSPDQIAGAFGFAFSEMQKITATNVRLNLWTPVGVTIKAVQQVYPSILPLTGTPNPDSPRITEFKLGSFGRDEKRDYVVDLTIPTYTPGQQFLMARPSLLYYVAGQGDIEEKTDKKGWIFAQWTDDPVESSKIERHVAHYTNQSELSTIVEEGHKALAQGDNERATQLLGRALQLSEQTGNENMTQMLKKIVTNEPNGTARLNKSASAVDLKSVAVNSGKTSRLK